MKKFITLLILLVIFGCCLVFQDEIVYFVVDAVTDLDKEHTELENNEYALEQDFGFVQLTDDFSPNNKQDIMNIYYTVINSGMTDFTFYCPKEYKTCIEDVDYISNNQQLLSTVNNFVSVYNSFSDIDTEFGWFDRISIHITHMYNEEAITTLENKVDDIISKNITDDMNIEEKIKVIHDYIINNTKYDTDRSDKKIINYQSDTAYGVLLENYGICSGYADSIKIFLEKLGLKNYKISSENHIWNLVYIDNSWHHLDLTWDDPITSTGKDVLDYDYFLITTEELNNYQSDQHIFDKEIYPETV